MQIILSIIPLLIAVLYTIIKRPGLLKSNGYISTAVVISLIGVLFNDSWKVEQILPLGLFGYFILACLLASLILNFGKKTVYHVLLLVINLIAMLLLTLYIIIPST